MTHHILEQIRLEIDAVTDEQLEAVPLLDLQEGDTVMGDVSDQPYIHRIWALAHDYSRRCSLAAHAAKFGGPKNRAALTTEAHWLDVQEDFIRDLAWLEIRRVLPQTLDCEVVGIRKGYVIVKGNGRREQMQEIVTAMREAMGKMMGVERQGPEEEEKVQ